MDCPLVSVHVVTYNQKPYIAQAIEGALRQQTSFPYEIVIGEDCSTDGTREIVLDYQKRYPEVIRVMMREHNVGAHVNTNDTHAACRAKYIAYCDGDDFWHEPQKLQMEVDFLEKHPDFGLVHTEGDWLVQATGERIPCWHKTYHRTVTQGDIYEDLLVDNQIMTVTACARKEYIDRFMNDQTLAAGRPQKAIGDYPRWLFVAAASKIGYLDISTATHREVLNSASVSTDARENYAFLLAVHDIQEHFFRLHPPGAGTKARVRSSFHREKLKHGYLMQDVQTARDSYAYLAQSGLLSVTDRLHWWGSKGKMHYTVARALIAAKDRIRQRRHDPARAAGAGRR